MNKNDWLTLRQNRFIFKRWIRPRISDAIVSEHRGNPFGKHSTDLDIVLNFVRRNPDPAVPLYVLVKLDASDYRIGHASGRRGQPIEVGEEPFSTEEQAEHAVFLQQLRDAFRLDSQRDRATR